MSRLSDALAGLEFGCELEDGELVADAIVICRTINAETGRSGVHYTLTMASDSITEAGLLSAAQQINAGSGGWAQVDGD